MLPFCRENHPAQVDSQTRMEPHGPIADVQSRRLQRSPSRLVSQAEASEGLGILPSCRESRHAAANYQTPMEPHGPIADVPSRHLRRLPRRLVSQAEASEGLGILPSCWESRHAAAD